MGTVSVPVAGGQSGTVDGSRMAYVDGGTVHMADADGDTMDTGVSAKIVGPVADIDDDGTLEVPSVDDQGTLRLIEPDGGTQQLATGAAYSKTTISFGDVDGDGTTAVIYENADDNSYVYPGRAGRVAPANHRDADEGHRRVR